MERFLREVEAARELSVAGAENFEAQSRLEELLHPWQIAGQNAGLEASTFMTNMASDFLENPFGAAADYMISDALLEWMGAGAEADDELVRLATNLGEMVAEALAFFHINLPGNMIHKGGPEQNPFHPAAMHDMMVNPPVNGLGAAPFQHPT